MKECDARTQQDLLLTRAAKTCRQQRDRLLADDRARRRNRGFSARSAASPRSAITARWMPATRRANQETLDVGRSARAGGHHRVRTGHQQSRGARRDSSVAAKIDRAVLPGGGPRRAATASPPIACCSGKSATRRCWCISSRKSPTRRNSSGPGSATTKSAASSRRGSAASPDLRPFWRESEMEIVRGLRHVQRRARMAHAAAEAPRQNPRRKAAAALRKRAEKPVPSDVDPDLREHLREWRRITAKQNGIAAFIVMHDTSLDELCRKRPGRSPSFCAFPDSASARRKCTASRF